MLSWNDYLDKEKTEGLEGQLMHELKQFDKWEKEGKSYAYYDFDEGLFEFATGLKKMPGTSNILVYQIVDGVYCLYFNYFIDGNKAFADCFSFPNDAIGLFDIDAKIEGTTGSEYGNMTVENFFNDNVSAIIDRLKSYAPEVVDEIEDRFLRRLTVPDLTCPLYDEVVEDYMKNNKEKIRVVVIKDYLETQLEIQKDYIKTNNWQ